MDETIRSAAISPLRQRLIDDMNMRRFSRETQRNYCRQQPISCPIVNSDPVVSCDQHSGARNSSGNPTIRWGWEAPKPDDTDHVE